jgi:hypothetical protein
MLADRQHLQIASTDAIRAQIRQTITRSAEPDLYYLDSLNADEANMARLMLEQTASIIAAAEHESAVVWRTVEPFIRANITAGHSVVVEGVAVLPGLITKLNVRHSVIFLGNQSPKHTKIVLDYAQDNPDTWLGGLNAATVEAYATYSRAFSSHIEQEARKYHQAYIEMSDSAFDLSLAVALKALQTA